MGVRFALALDVTTDELLYPKARQTATSKPGLKVLRRLRQIERLPPNPYVRLPRLLGGLVQLQPVP
jgi:hypothetical protein